MMIRKKQLKIQEETIKIQQEQLIDLKNRLNEIEDKYVTLKNEKNKEEYNNNMYQDIELKCIEQKKIIRELVDENHKLKIDKDSTIIGGGSNNG